MPKSNLGLATVVGVANDIDMYIYIYTKRAREV